MPVGAIVGGAATLGSAVIGSSAAKSAAKTQAAAANQATDVQQQMYNTTRGDLSPYNSYGQAALPALQKLLGIGSGSSAAAGSPDWDAYLAANPDVAAWAASGHGDPTLGTNQTPEQAAAYQYQNTGQSEGRALPTVTAQSAAAGQSGIEDQLSQLPGYQFTRDQGIASANRTLGSTGQTGAQAKGIARFVTGLADNTYNSQVQNLATAAGLGENAAAQTGNIGAGYSQGISNTITGAGAASAAGTVGAANAATGALGQVPSYLYANKILGMYGSGGSSTPNYTTGAAGADDVTGLY